MKTIAAKIADMRVKLDELRYGSHTVASRSLACHTLLEDCEGAGNDRPVEFLSRTYGAALSQ